MHSSPRTHGPRAVPPGSSTEPAAPRSLIPVRFQHGALPAESPGSPLTIERAQSQPHVSLSEAQHDALVLEVLGKLLQLL